jgi:hypothetical protein
MSQVCRLGLLPALADEEPPIGIAYNYRVLLKLFTVAAHDN